jgi:hypothetical protein
MFLAPPALYDRLLLIASGAIECEMTPEQARALLDVTDIVPLVPERPTGETATISLRDILP